MKNIAAAATGCLLLVACSAGGSSGGGTAVTPTPTPTATASPSPTPTPTYAKVADLAGDQDYITACDGIYPLNASNTPGLNGKAALGPGMISYTVATQTYRVRGVISSAQTFGPAERDASVPTGTVASYTRATTLDTYRFALRELRINGTPLEYVRTTEAMLYAGSTDYCVLGVPTLVTDVPRGTSVTWPEVAVSGTAYDSSSGTSIAYDLAKSSATLRGDLTTGRVYLTINLIGSIAGQPDKDLGSYSGDASVGIMDGVVTNVGFTGPFLVPSGSFVSMTGGFFGPQGKEFALVFDVLRYSYPAPGASVNGFTVAARVYGRR